MAHARVVIRSEMYRANILRPLAYILCGVRDASILVIDLRVHTSNQPCEAPRTLAARFGHCYFSQRATESCPATSSQYSSEHRPKPWAVQP
jgi:hypothetical protein